MQKKNCSSFRELVEDVVGRGAFATDVLIPFHLQ
jgi:hypothetical protein